ncbi:MAG: 50S ribosomal protein L17 [Patescibacteria group bacterium]
MRHRKNTKTLDRKTGPRKALLKNLIGSLLIYEKIETTEGKAKVIKPMVEKLITIGRVNDLTSRRRLIKELPAGSVVDKVLDILGPRYKARTGGYTRIVKLSPRKGDGAEVVQISFV